MARMRMVALLACILAAGCGGIRAKREGVIHRTAAVLLHPGRMGLEASDGLHCAACGGLCRDDRLESDSAGSVPAGMAAEQALGRGRRAEGHSWTRALVAYREAASLAVTACVDPADSDPTRAVEIHNAAVERLLRLAWGRGTGPNAQRVLAALGMALTGANPQLDPDRIEALDIAADYRITGLTHRFCTGGIGVPVVVRWNNPRANRQSVQDQYYPEQVVAAASAVLHPETGELRLHDPFEETGISLASGRVLPLARDRTAAIAVQVERDRSLRGAAFGGAINASLKDKYEERLAMLRPHRPGRIPVVFVHGLASSPLIWAETINELGNDLEIAERFEFWNFLYASGEPIPLSAAKLRENIAAARQAFDPAATDPTLQQMVVVGHSQGGLLTKTLAQDSGLTLWNEVLHIPHPAALLTPATQASLERALIYQRDSGIRRLVFVGTPHQGSPVADNILVRGISLISRPEESVARDTREVRQTYGRDRIQGGFRGDTLGLNNLRPSSSVLAALNRIPLDPGVPHHTIALQLDRFNPNGGDGLVPYASAHLDTALSEVIVPGFHLNINQAGVTEELRRILRLHLSENPPASVDAAATAPEVSSRSASE